MAKKDTFTRLAPKQAWSILEENPAAVLVDVRSDMEYLMIGHPKGAFHIPWIDEPDWTINEHFVADVRKLLLGRVSGAADGNVPVILICRSSNRSADAAQALVDDGLHDISIVEGGFEGPLDDDHHRGTLAGWRFDNLPWEQC